MINALNVVRNVSGLFLCDCSSAEGKYFIISQFAQKMRRGPSNEPNN